MTPWKIPVLNKWVNLECVQWINEPVMYASGEVHLYWGLAFQDTPSKSIISAEYIWVDGSYRQTNETKAEALRIMSEDIFKPFLTAWMEQK